MSNEREDIQGPSIGIEPHFTQRFEEINRVLHERDVRYEQRFDAQEEAVSTTRRTVEREILDAYDRLREYFDAQLREKERALDMAAAERDRAAEVLRDEQRRAIATAEAEREKAASALRVGAERAIADNYARLHEYFSAILSEKERATDLATEEREKAAQALREAMVRTIEEGDDRLREHIQNQIEQIRAALASGELLEIERITAIRNELLALIDANVREFRTVHQASEKAVQKAEEAQGRVNVSQNEFRGSLADVTGTMMPRKEVEALLTEQKRQISENRDGLATVRQDVAVGPSGLRQLQAGADQQFGAKASGQNTQRTFFSIVGLFLTMCIIIASVVAIIVSQSHTQPCQQIVAAKIVPC